ncbi:hypothetical protein ACFC1T_09640 [Kitasatospora sp. NPDC056076]|uniref:hypothetical protein n=1 Tax=Kitasatospora sp. NPDC056076 TaxID=3345703 RepID=UPI0035E0C974
MSTDTFTAPAPGSAWAGIVGQTDTPSTDRSRTVLLTPSGSLLARPLPLPLMAFDPDEGGLVEAGAVTEITLQQTTIHAAGHFHDTGHGRFLAETAWLHAHGGVPAALQLDDVVTARAIVPVADDDDDPTVYTVVSQWRIHGILLLPYGGTFPRARIWTLPTRARDAVPSP